MGVDEKYLVALNELADLRAKLAETHGLLAASESLRQQYVEEFTRRMVVENELRAELAVAKKELAHEEQAHLDTIRTRDGHEARIGEIGGCLGLTEYELEWSSLNDVGEVCRDRALELVQQLAAAKERERAAVLKCIEIVEDTDPLWSGRGYLSHEDAQGTLREAVKAIRAAFPEVAG